LIPGTPYYVRVRARDSSDAVSNYSPTASFITAAAPPGEVYALATPQAGVSLSHPNGALLSVDPGVLVASITIRMRELDATNRPALGEIVQRGPGMTLGPDASVVAVSARLTLPYAQDGMPVKLYTWAQNKWAPVASEPGSNGLLSAQLAHFSIYAPLFDRNEFADNSILQFYAFPNPFTGTASHRITFHLELQGYANTIWLKIYNLRGEMRFSPTATW